MYVDIVDECELITGEAAEIDLFGARGVGTGRMARVPEYVRDGGWGEMIGFEVYASTGAEERNMKLGATGGTGSCVIGVGFVVCFWDGGGSEDVGED